MIEGSLENRGRVNPTGWLRVTEDYSQSPLASLRITIAGKSDGQYGRGIVSQTATIDGIAEAELASGFVPEKGDVYTILSAADIIGQFRQYIDVNSGGGWKFDPQFVSDASGDSITLVATFSSGPRITGIQPIIEAHVRWLGSM